MSGTSDNAFDRIVEAALKEFCTKGYHLTTMESIAKEAGITKGAIYWHFKSKRHLFKHLVDNALQELNHRINQAISCQAAPPERILSAISAGVEYYENHRDFCALVKLFHTEGVLLVDPEFEAYLRGTYARYRQAIAGAFQEGIEQGYFRPEINPKAAAALVISTFDGISFQWLLEPEAFPLHDVLPLARIVIQRGFGAEGAAAELPADQNLF